jgi:hypothetical protein
MRVLVCGGRGFSDALLLNLELDRLHALHHFTLVIHGAALGTDALAGEWADSRNIPVRPYRANWKAEGKSAGPNRNARMLADGRPELVVAFKGGAGTANMIEQAETAGVKVIRIGKT